MDWSKLPEPLTKALLPFQKEGVRFAVEKNGRCLIADEMGLGKTLQAISVACVYRNEWPLLVIVPSCVKFCWIEEIEKWLPDILPQDINLIQSGADASGIANSPISIVTYGLLRIPSAKLLQDTIRRRKFQVVICDESHYLKNAMTLSAKIIVPIIKMAKRRILLSGTPALARPVELYPQLDAVCPGKWDTFWKFTERYCEPRYLHFGRKRQRKADGASNLEELQQRMTGMLMIRREKSEVLTELPPKQRQRVLFELKESNLKKDISKKFELVRKNIHKGSKTFQQLASSMESVPNQENDPASSSTQAQEHNDGLGIFRDISTLYRMSGEAKIGPVREYIEMLCENEDLKFLVFAYHHNMMNGVEQSLHAKKVRFVRIDGQTKPVDRQACVAQFQSDPSTRVAILSILAAGVGLTLTSAKLVVFAELYWTPGVMVQCEDRAHRIGQTSRLSVHYLVAKNTMDEWVWSSVCKKTIVTSAALSGKRRQLEHNEGEQYQIDVLSKADVWTPKEVDGADVEDVSNLIKSQRERDQSSILDFFPSPRQHNTLSANENNVMKKSAIGLHMSNHRRLRFASPATKIKAMNKNLDNSLIVIDSDEEEDFKPVVKKRKKMNTFHKDVEFMEEEVDDNSVENRKNDLKLQNVMQSSGEMIDLLSQEKEGGVGVSDREDRFSIDSSDSDSDSLPDVYLGPNFKQNKNAQDKNDTEAKGFGIDDGMKNDSVDCTQDGQINGSFHSKSPSKTENRKWELLQGEAAMVPLDNKCSSEMEQNSILEVDNEPKQLITSQSLTDTPKSSSDIPDDIKSHSHESLQSNLDLLHKSDIKTQNGQHSMSCERQVDLNSKGACDRNCKSESEQDLSDGEYLLSDSQDSIPKILTTPQKDQREQSNIADPNQWSCSMCTFLNHQDVGQCEMCDTPSKLKTRNKKKMSNQLGLGIPSECKHNADSGHSEQVSCYDSDERMEDFNQTLNNKDTIDCYDKDHDRPHSIINNYKFGNFSRSQLEEGDEDYVIENINSDSSDEDEGGSKRVLKEEGNPFVVENSCSDENYDAVVSSGNCDTGKSYANYTKTKIKNDCSDWEFSDVCDSADHINVNNKVEVTNSGVKVDNGNKCNFDKGVDLYSSGVKKGSSSNTCKTKDNYCVKNPDKVGLEEEDLFLGDELSNEDFDQIEDFLSVNGHINVSKETKNSSLSVIPTSISSRSSSFFQSSSSPLLSSPTSKSKSTITAIKVSATSSPSPTICHRAFQFSCSLNTGRIYLYDEEGQSLNVNFQPVDIEMGNTDRLPEFLKEPHHYRLLQRFAREWMSLTATKRRVIAKQGIVFEKPLLAYESVRSVHGSTQRHLVKDNLSVATEKAESIQGHIRFIQRPQLDNVTPSRDDDREKTVDGPVIAQVVTSDGVPLCLHCHKPYTNPLLPAQVITKPENAWQLRLCSRTCMDKYWTLKHASYLRDQIFEIEKGICRLCQFDAQGFYNRMKCNKDLRQRAELVNKSPYHKLGQKAREKLVTQVMQGQFWHVDHIIPVWRGGGMCDLDNLRTLCTPCHMKVTKGQAGERANIRKLSSAVSSGDITAFFKKS